MTQTTYILMGSNLGDREKNLDIAREQVEQVPGLELIAASAVYVSPAQDMKGDSPEFLNQALMGDYDFQAEELLDALEAIERDLGRQHKGKYMPRTIDLDILIFGDQIIETDRLCVPHRELLKRPFALVPLVQISPELKHPITERPIAEYLTEAMLQNVSVYKDHVARNV